MARHELVEALTNADGPPTLAIGGCLLFMDEVAPDLLAVVESAAAGTLDRPADENLLFIALHILSGGRVQRLHEPLMRLLRRPADEVEELLGSAKTDTLGQIVAGAFNGNANDLFDLLCEPDLDEFVRARVFGAVAFLTWADRIDESATRAFLERFDQQRPIPDDDWSWFSWSAAIELLGWEDLAPRAEQAYRDGRIPDWISELRHFHDGLAAAKAAPAGDDSRFQSQGQGYIKDVAVSLEGYNLGSVDDNDDEDPFGDDNLFVDDDPPPRPSLMPDRNPHRHVGRNDPCPCGSGKKYKRCCLAA